MIHFAVDVSPAPQAALLGAPPRILSVGRFKAPKDPLTVARALAQLDPGSFHTTLIGDGPDRPAVRGRYARRGSTSPSTWSASDTNVLALLAGADAFVLWSLSEGRRSRCWRRWRRPGRGRLGGGRHAIGRGGGPGASGRLLCDQCPIPRGGRPLPAHHGTPAVGPAARMPTDERCEGAEAPPFDTTAGARSSLTGPGSNARLEEHKTCATRASDSSRAGGGARESCRSGVIDESRR
jgi:hypothetical protein